VSKALHAAEGQEKQAKQHAASLKSAAYAAQALAGKESELFTTVNDTGYKLSPVSLLSAINNCRFC
jgi:hypothetical protein